MSGATGAGSGGPGAEGRAPAGPTTVQGGVRGAVDDNSSQEASHQGGTQGGNTAVTDTRQPYPQQPAQPYHPPQAYPSPGGEPQPGPMPNVPGQVGRGAAGAQPSGTPPVGGPAVRRPRTGAGARTTPRTRKARLRVAKADPWSVMKVSFLLSIALGVCTVVAVSVLWLVLDAMGVFSTVGETIGQATGTDEGGGFDLESFLSLSRVLTFTSVIAVIDVVLATALATLGAFIYNLSAGFVGGVELTLAEDE